MTTEFLAHLNAELTGLKDAGLYKSERIIASRQAGTVAHESGREVINLCANNYLGLCQRRIDHGRSGRAGALWLRDVLSPVHLRHARGTHRARKAHIWIFGI